MAIDVMTLSAKLNLDTSAYEAALRAAVSEGQSFASNLGSVSSSLQATQAVASASGSAMANAAHGAQEFGQDAAQAAANVDRLGDEINETTQQSEQYEQQTDESEDSTRQLGAAMQKASLLGNLMADAIRKGASMLVQFSKESISAGMNFDSSMSQVAATMGTTVDEVQNLREYAQKMGSETVFSATESAQALNYMALAGYDAEKSMAMLPNVLNLAASGGMQLATASDMVTDAQSALGLSMDETTELVNKMAKTASSSNTSVAQLGEAILQIGGSAKKLKGGTTELATILGILADNGMKGAEGGTHLRNMLNSLMSPTKDATEMMSKLGVSLYDTEGNMRSFNDVFIDLRDGMNSLATQAERDQVISSIFNARDMKAAEAMIAGVGDRYSELSGKIEEAAGAAQQMADTQLDNLKGDITLFKSAVEGAQIAVSDKLTPSLRKFTQFGSKAVSEMSKQIGEKGLSGAISAFHLVTKQELGDAANGIFAVESATKAAITAFVTYKAVVKGMALIKSIQGIVTAIKGAETAQAAWNAVAELNPYAAIAAAVLAVGVALRSYIDAQTDAIEVAEDGLAGLSDRQKAVVASFDDTMKAISDNSQARKENAEEIEHNAKVSGFLIDKLYKLDAIENKSADQKAEMSAIVEELNGNIQGLNLSFNEETGTLNRTRESVDKLMDSYIHAAKVEAAKENLVALTKEQFDAEQDLNKVTEEKERLEQRRNRLQKINNAFMINDLDTLQKMGVNLENLGDEEENAATELRKVENALGDVNARYANAGRVLRGVNDEMKEMRIVLGGSAEDIGEATAQAENMAADGLAKLTLIAGNSAEVFYDEANNMSGVMLDIGMQTSELSENTAISIGELIDAYDNLLEKQREAISGSLDFFGGFNAEVTTTFDELWNNLNATSKGLENWAIGIEELSGRPISEDLLQQLKDMGTKSWSYVASLNSATDEQLAEYSQLWDDAHNSVNDVTDRMVADQKKTIEEKLQEMSGIPDAHIEDFKEAYAAMGVAADEGFADGIKSKMDEYVKASASDMGDAAIDATAEALDSHSPSEEYAKLGRYAAQGFANGMTENNSLSIIANAAKTMATEAINAVMDTLNTQLVGRVTGLQSYNVSTQEAMYNSNGVTLQLVDGAYNIIAQGVANPLDLINGRRTATAMRGR